MDRDGGVVVYGGRFRAVAYVARRPWATVFRAVDEQDGGVVALSVVSPEATPGPTFGQHLQDAAGLVQGFSHPNLLPVLTVGEDQGAHFVAEEWVDGPTLAEVVAARGPLPADRVAILLDELASGLGAAHDAGIVHGGPAPADVWLVGGPGGVARLHGLALLRAVVMASIEQGLPPAGERPYLAPERLEGAPAAPAADLYGLGALAFEALCGVPPFGRDGRAPGSDPPWPSDLVEGIPEGLDDIVLDLLEADPADRHHDAAELRDELVPYVRPARVLSGAGARVPSDAGHAAYEAVAAPEAPEAPEAPDPVADESPSEPVLAQPDEAQTHLVESAPDAASLGAAAPDEGDLGEGDPDIGASQLDDVVPDAGGDADVEPIDLDPEVDADLFGPPVVVTAEHEAFEQVAGDADAGHDDAGHDDAGHDDAGHDDAGHDDAGHVDADEGGDAWGADVASGAQAEVTEAATVDQTVAEHGADDGAEDDQDQDGEGWDGDAWDGEGWDGEGWNGEGWDGEAWQEQPGGEPLASDDPWVTASHDDESGRGRLRLTPLVGAAIVAVLLGVVALGLLVVDRAIDTQAADDTADETTTSTTEATTSTTATTVALGPPAELPNVVGTGVFQAAEAVNAAGFVAVPEVRVDPFAQRGFVVEQIPPPGQVPQGSEVRLVYAEPEPPPAG